MKNLLNLKKNHVNIRIKKSFKWKPSPIFNSLWINKFMNILNTKGKKILTQKIILNTFYIIKKQLTNIPIFLFFFFLELLRCKFEISLVKIGKKKHEVPIPTNSIRQYLALFRTIKKFFKKSKNSIKFEIKFANEIINVFEKKTQSELLRHKTNMFSKAIANRSYLHFRWK